MLDFETILSSKRTKYKDLANNSFVHLYIIWTKAPQIKYEYNGKESNRPKYYASSVNLHLIYLSWHNSWYHSKSDDLNNFQYYHYVQDTSECPPMTWSSITVVCDHLGASSLSPELEEFTIEKIYASIDPPKISLIKGSRS